MDQNIEFSGSDQIQSPQYPEIHPPSQEKSDEVFQANHSVQYKENLENSSDSNQEKEEPTQDSDMHQLIEECSTEICEEVVHKNSISLNNTSQISSIHAITPFLSTKEPEHSLSMGYEHLSITPETESDEVTESNAENLLPIPSECEVTLEDEIYDDDFEDIEYVEVSLFYPEIVSVEEENDVEEENVVNQEEEEVDLKDISQIQDVVLRKKILSITRFISNIESLNDNPTPDHVLNSFESDNSLSDNFSPEFEIFCDYWKETRSGNTTHADNSLPEYDSFCFEIEPDQERLINLMKSNISDDSSNDFLLEEADLFLSDNSIPLGIEIFANDTEGDVRFLEELLIDDSILSHESSDSNFEDNSSIPRPPPEPPDAETDAGEEIPVMMNDKDEDVYSSFIFVIFAKVFSFSSPRVRIRSLTLDLPPMIEVFLCWIFVSVSKIFTSFD
nr:hypothetical protein [Tanacetum cinerariifolium]